MGYLSRKALPIKRADSVPLSREDVQYDLLQHIFADKNVVFTSQAPGTIGKVHFCDLYVNAIYHSTRCSKVLKDKMVETPAFAVELAKLSLLTNVGRINTTMAFFPEMKTALRSYHPVPSLQKTDGNAQDAPRIKNCLKAALLPSEYRVMPPSTPEEILEKSRARTLPPTSVVNLIFVLANHAAPLANVHFESPLNFLDLFLPVRLSSADRARAFLWLIFHYLEGPDEPNPFEDSYSRQHPGKIPRIRQLTEPEAAIENCDTEEELEWGSMMSAKRRAFLKRLIENQDREGPSPVTRATVSSTSMSTSQSKARNNHEQNGERAYIPYVPHVASLSIPNQVSPSQTSAPVPTSAAPTQGTHSMLEHAWSVIRSTDPLADSDEELMDERVLADYSRRVEVISRLRGRPPTPPVT